MRPSIAAVALFAALAAGASAISQHGQPFSPPAGSTPIAVEAPLRAEPAIRLEADAAVVEWTPPAGAVRPLKLAWGKTRLVNGVPADVLRLSVAEPMESIKAGGTAAFRITLSEEDRKQPEAIVYRIESREGAALFTGRLREPAAPLLPALVAGPAIDQLTTSKAVISWSSSEELSTVVTFGNRTLIPAGDRKDAELRLDGLQPRTSYPWEIKSGERSVASGTLTTPGSTKFTFAAFGAGAAVDEWPLDDHPVREMALAAAERQPGFAIIAGGHIGSETTRAADYEARLRRLLRIVDPIRSRLPVYLAFSNDKEFVAKYRDAGGAIIRADGGAEEAFTRVLRFAANGPKDEGFGSPAYGRTAYAFDHSNVRVLVLSSDYWFSDDAARHGGNEPGYYLPSQLDWLAREIRRADDDGSIDHVFVVAQRPPFPLADTPGRKAWSGDGKPPREDDPDMVANRNTLWFIVASSHKTVAMIAGGGRAAARLLVAKDTDLGSRRLLNDKKAKFANPVWQIQTSDPVPLSPAREAKDAPWGEEILGFGTEPRFHYFTVSGKDVLLETFNTSGRKLEEVILRQGGKNTREEPKKGK